MTSDATASSAALSPRDLFGALSGFGRGLLRPRRPDDRLLASISDAGLPRGDRTVTVRPLPQVSRALPAGGIIEGAGPLRRVRNAMTGFVVEHPDATFVVDPSYCRDAPERALAELPGMLRRLVAPPADTVATVDSLRAAQVRPDFALPTHAHWDHVCGLLDLPSLPVHLRTIERDWILGPGPAPVGGVRPALTDGRSVETYDLGGPPVATFTASHDMFGDGSVILVDLAGHTPGSIGVLARTATGWVLIAGDAAWHYDQVDLIRQKPSFPGDFVDEDRDAAFAALHRLHLARHQMRIVPTHDHDATSLL
ncbi:MBL fold metallo-hydrolase [Nocardioides albertanoniae]|uniref:MBL fold metallo-hydrolase n=1 Tax=Nocardioides albertanoniae TaxID=1175486 RepID=UPI0011533E34|nr:MBL fold metallo-hydrolase [Nocardioides albertanoniae]